MDVFSLKYSIVLITGDCSVETHERDFKNFEEPC